MFSSPSKSLGTVYEHIGIDIDSGWNGSHNPLIPNPSQGKLTGPHFYRSIAVNWQLLCHQRRQTAKLSSQINLSSVPHTTVDSDWTEWGPKLSGCKKANLPYRQRPQANAAHTSQKTSLHHPDSCCCRWLVVVQYWVIAQRLTVLTIGQFRVFELGYSRAQALCRPCPQQLQVGFQRKYFSMQIVSLQPDGQTSYFPRRQRVVGIWKAFNARIIQSVPIEKWKTYNMEKAF